jgi:hypothetical protein
VRFLAFRQIFTQKQGKMLLPGGKFLRNTILAEFFHQPVADESGT